MNGAIYVSDSRNSKLGVDIDTTYASIETTCPSSCQLKSKGCYAENGYVGITATRLNKESKYSTALQVARTEAKTIIDAKPNGKDLRLHMSGDSRTIKGSRLINRAVGIWKIKGGNTCFSYTHAWKHVPRKTWKNVSMLASIDSINEIKLARKQGYAPAIIVPEFKNDKAFKVGKTIFIPCPEQTRGIQCRKCRLCMKADWLYRTNRGIAFQAHGVKKNLLKRKLTVII